MILRWLFVFQPCFFLDRAIHSVLDKTKRQSDVMRKREFIIRKILMPTLENSVHYCGHLYRQVFTLIHRQSDLSDRVFSEQHVSFEESFNGLKVAIVEAVFTNCLLGVPSQNNRPKNYQ